MNGVQLIRVAVTEHEFCVIPVPDEYNGSVPSAVLSVMHDKYCKRGRLVSATGGAPVNYIWIHEHT